MIILKWYCVVCMIIALIENIKIIMNPEKNVQEHKDATSESAVQNAALGIIFVVIPFFALLMGI